MHSALGFFVSHVVSLCAEKKMGLVDTRRVVTAVQDAEPIRNWAVFKLPGNTMREQISSFTGPGGDDPVAISVREPCPENAAAFGCRSDVAAKSYHQRDRLPRSTARLRAEFPPTVFDVVGVDLKIFTTLRTRTTKHHALWPAHDGTLPNRRR